MSGVGSASHNGSELLSALEQLEQTITRDLAEYQKGVATMFASEFLPSSFEDFRRADEGVALPWRIAELRGRYSDISGAAKTPKVGVCEPHGG